ncbi:MAG TPA: hypothetical protein VKA94_13560 [Hyphomicrobiales bacterium]|nr:hypothetical protein [Hyphomicrobiales bacterium]
MMDASEFDPEPDNGETREQRETLKDFFVDRGDGARGLLPAEQKALDAAILGIKCEIADERPTEMTVENRLRAKFLRFLILGAGEEIFVHERGVHLVGGYIEGPLELDYIRCPTPLSLEKCEFEKRFAGLGARFVALILNGSRCHGVNFDDARFTSSVEMAQGFECNGPVRLTGVCIGGDLNFQGAKLVNPDGDALAARRIIVGRSVFLTNGVVADGRVRLSGAEIGGDLSFFGGRFIRRKAAIPSDPYEMPRADYALTLTNVHIKSVLWLGPWTKPFDKQVRIEGSLNLQGAYAATLADDEHSWPVKSIVTDDGKRVPCIIALDGFVYDRLRAGAPIRASIRQKWLMRTQPRKGGPEFRPQPFEQLISVLRRMGFEQDARRIGLLKEHELQEVRVKRASFWARPFLEIFGAFWGGFAGYGYKPHRLVVMLFSLWALSSVFFYAAEKAGGFVPLDPDVWANEMVIRECGTDDWTVCPRVARIMPFNAVSYAADTILPVIDLQQRSSWTPMLNGLMLDLPLIGEMYLPYGGLYSVTWVVNILGALGAILLGAIMSGLVTKD